MPDLVPVSIGDFILMTHPAMTDTVVVAGVIGVNASTIIVETLLIGGKTAPKRRGRAAVIGVIGRDAEAARFAHGAIMQAAADRRAAMRQATQAYHDLTRVFIQNKD